MRRAARAVTAGMDSAALFEPYTHSRAVIFACLQGQYPGTVYRSPPGDPAFALLTTPFDFHFVAGDAGAPGAAEMLEQALFGHYLPGAGRAEAVAFSPSAAWDAVLASVFARHAGVTDSRRIFALDAGRFARFRRDLTVPEGVEVRLAQEQGYGALGPYPAARVYVDGRCVSCCAGFMLGAGRGEIDVGTEPGYEGRGYATLAATALVGALLDRGVAPDWCTWPYRQASQHLAKKLGFEPRMDVRAHIWQKPDTGDD